MSTSKPISELAESLMETVNELRGGLDDLQIQLMEAVEQESDSSPLAQKLLNGRLFQRNQSRSISLVRDT